MKHNNRRIFNTGFLLSVVLSVAYSNSHASNSFEYGWDGFDDKSYRKYHTINLIENGTFTKVIKAKEKKKGSWIIPYVTQTPYSVLKKSKNAAQVVLKEKYGERSHYTLTVRGDYLHVKGRSNRSLTHKWRKINQRQYKAFKAMLYFIKDQAPTLALFKAIERADVNAARNALENGAWIRGYSTYYNLTPANFAINVSASNEMILLLNEYEPNGFDARFFAKLPAEMKLKILSLDRLPNSVASIDWAQNLDEFTKMYSENELLKIMNGWVPQFENKNWFDTAISILTKKNYSKLIQHITKNSKAPKKSSKKSWLHQQGYR